MTVWGNMLMQFTDGIREIVRIVVGQASTDCHRPGRNLIV